MISTKKEVPRRRDRVSQEKRRILSQHSPIWFSRERISNATERASGESTHAHLPSMEVDSVELEDGTLVELVEDPEDPTRALLAVFKEGVVFFTDHFEHRGKILVPKPRNSEGLADIRLPRGVIPNNSVEELKFHVFNFISYCVHLPDEYRAVLASFALYTWVADRLPTAVYLSVIGLPATGKTTLLELLNLLCRRPLLVSDITPAAAQQTCSRFAPTLLIDENDWHAGAGSRIRRQQLRAGTTRQLLVRRVQQTGHCFGPKVLSSLEPPDDAALNSRCIHIPMVETNKTNLLKPTDPRLRKYGDEFQKHLLQFRFDLYKTVQPAVIPGAEKLRPRARDLLSSLAAPLADDEMWCKFLLEFFLAHEPATQEPLPPAQDATLAALFHLIHLLPGEESITVGSFGETVNNVLRQAGKRFTLQPRKIGSVLTSMGFTSRERTSRGWRIWLDSAARRRIHTLVKAYGNEHLGDPLLRIRLEICEICRELGIVARAESPRKDKSQ